MLLIYIVLKLFSSVSIFLLIFQSKYLYVNYLSLIKCLIHNTYKQNDKQTALNYPQFYELEKLSILLHVSM